MKNIFLLFFLSSFFTSFAQYQIGLIPRTSPDKTISQKIGFTDIKIEYGSPRVKNREIWGSLVPFDEIWRAGANNATTVEFSEDVKVNGKDLAKGKYALFILPRNSTSWYIILSKKHNQWGSFRYDKADDAVRIEVLPINNDFTENLTYRITNRGFNDATIALLWGKIKIEFGVRIDYFKTLENKIEENAKGVNEDIKWVSYLQGGEYLVEQKKKLDLAKKWLDKSEELSKVEGEWNKQYYPRDYILGHLYWTKAKLYALNKDYKNALIYAKKVKTFTGKSSFYSKNDKWEGIDKLMQQWQNK